jgi:ribosomal protein L11 methyltransferase
MDYLELTVAVRAEAAEAAADLLRRRAPAGVSIEAPYRAIDEEGGVALDPRAPVRLRAWLPTGREASATIALARRELRGLGDSLVRPLRARTVSDASWADAWKRYFRTLRVGRAIVIRPSWRRHRRKRGETVIELDPGMAFGTGQHATTQLCLEALEERIAPGAVGRPPFDAAQGRLRPGPTVLDVGSGSGILSIAAALLGAKRVDAVDIDPAAVRATKENAERNGVGRIVRARRGSLGEAWPFSHAQTGRYDLVLANLSSRLAQELAEPLVAALQPFDRLRAQPGGVALVSGLIDAQEAACRRALRRAGGRVLESRGREGWRLLVVGPATGQPRRTSRTPDRPSRRARRSPSEGAGPSRGLWRRSSR